MMLLAAAILSLSDLVHHSGPNRAQPDDAGFHAAVEEQRSGAE